LQPGNQGNHVNIYQKKPTYIRKYNPSYLSFGFMRTGEESAPVPQCVICYETLSNHSIKPSLIMHHSETKHEHFTHKPLEYFQRKLSDLSASKCQIMSFSGVNMKAVEASNKVSLRIAKAGKTSSHTIGESLLLPAARYGQFSFGRESSKTT
jgi:hypothetical protein